MLMESYEKSASTIRLYLEDDHCLEPRTRLLATRQKLTNGSAEDEQRWCIASAVLMIELLLVSTLIAQRAFVVPVQ